MTKQAEQLPLSQPHSGCKFFKCTVNFRTGNGTSVKTSSRADENGWHMALAAMEALVFVHGYEGALEVAKKAADEYKHHWPE